MMKMAFNAQQGIMTLMAERDGAWFIVGQFQTTEVMKELNVAAVRAAKQNEGRVVDMPFYTPKAMVA